MSAELLAPSRGRAPTRVTITRSAAAVADLVITAGSAVGEAMGLGPAAAGVPE